MKDKTVKIIVQIDGEIQTIREFHLPTFLLGVFFDQIEIMVTSIIKLRDAKWGK